MADTKCLWYENKKIWSMVWGRRSWKLYKIDLLLLTLCTATCRLYRPPKSVYHRCDRPVAWDVRCWIILLCLPCISHSQKQTVKSFCSYRVFNSSETPVRETCLGTWPSYSEDAQNPVAISNQLPKSECRT